MIWVPLSERRGEGVDSFWSRGVKNWDPNLGNKKALVRGTKRYPLRDWPATSTNPAEMNPPCAKCKKTVYPVEKLNCLDKVRCLLKEEGGKGGS